MASYLRNCNTRCKCIFNKKEKVNFVKYACVFAYIGIEIANILSYMLYNKAAFDGVNIIEIILIFFVPIFLNKNILCLYFQLL